MRHLPYSKWLGYATLSLLAAGFANACSSGSDNPPGKTGSGGSTGSTTTSPTTSTTTSPTTGTTTDGTTGTTQGTGGAGPGTGGSTGTGGTGTGGGTGKSVCDGTGTRLLMDPFVDDFETGTAPKDGWSTFNNVMPVADSFKLMLEAGGAVNTGHAGHYSGTGAKTPMMGGYGVGLVYNAAIDKANGIYCINIMNYDGVTFWAKAAMAGLKVDVNFVLPETNETTVGGDCVQPGCYNHPRKTITLTTTWAQYSVAFADAGGGSAKVTTRIQELGWLTPYTADWDYWIDEIQFYKGTPPTGPAAHGDGGP